MSELDEFFGSPFVDVDEWRETPQRHRYIHGGFESTDTRFSTYFPPVEQYEGRGFTQLEGGWAGNENTMQTLAGGISGGLLLPLLLGGFLVESNQGHFPNDLTGLQGDVTIQDYRATAEATRFAVALAAEMYGAAPHHLYVYGGSGGGHRSVRVAENTGDLFAGAVPFMVPLQQQAAVAGGARNRAARFLHRKIDQIIDAVEPGGSGNPFEGLDAFERQTLAELYRSGYPRGSEFLLYSLYGSIAGYGAAQRGGAPTDTTYVEDFWTTPGYLGHDRPELFAPLLVDSKATVARVATRGEAMSAAGRDIFEMRRALRFRQQLPDDLPSGLLLDGVDHARLWMGDEVEVLTGKLAGRKLSATAVVDGVLYFLPGAVGDMAPGDEVRVDNRNSLAQLWHELYNQDPDTFWDDLGFPTYAADGVPMYPQRTVKWDPGLLNFPTHTGRFSGKMIMLQHAQDSTIANPFSAHAYRTLVHRHLGDRTDDQYRLWYVADAHHLPPEFLPDDDRPHPSTKLVNAGGILARALAAMVAWVENGAPPSPTTSYRMSGSLQLHLASGAADRSGLQAITHLAADGAERTDVPARTPVTFTVEAELPPGAGAIRAVQWNFDGGADWSEREMINAGSRLSVTVEHVYELPGTYFPAVRVLSAPEDRLGVDAYEVQSLARARVVVGPRPYASQVRQSNRLPTRKQTMTERSFTDLGWLQAETELRAECLEPGFAIRPIVDTATWLYDCQLGWLEPDGSVIFHDIGGQGEPGWDPENGHGSTWRLHRDNRLDCIVAPGSSGRAMLMSPLKSPEMFGEYANAIFELGQLRPGRTGAHNTHGVFWVPPETGRVELYAVCPDSGILNGGKSGALVSPGWATPEDPVLYVTSMLNCTMYKLDSRRRIWPWVIGDGEHEVPQFMPREVFRAGDDWEEFAGELVVCGVAGHHFGSPAPLPGEPAKKETLVRYLVHDRGSFDHPTLTPIDREYSIPKLSRYSSVHLAPDGFGPFGGQEFKVTPGSVNLMQTTMMPDGPLPYDSQIVRIDNAGVEHVFVDKIQSGHPGLIFQGDRLLLSRVGKSYSTGNFHHPDGSLYEIVYLGT